MNKKDFPSNTHTQKTLNIDSLSFLLLLIADKALA